MEIAKYKDVTRAYYYAVHRWLKQNFEKLGHCELCGEKSERIHWALKRGKKYEKERNNFLCLGMCCHQAYDRIKDNDYGRHWVTMKFIRMGKSEDWLVKNLKLPRYFVRTKIKQSQEPI